MFITLSLKTLASHINSDPRIDYTLSKFCDAQENVQHRNNHSTIFFANQDLGITASSLCIWKDEYGQWKSTGNYKKGKKDGVHKSWYRNGQIEAQGDYKNGKEIGVHNGWWINGQIYSEDFYVDGIKEGKSIRWHENGNKRFESNYKNGNKIGKDLAWLDNGSLVKELNYELGLKEGKAYIVSSAGLAKGSYRADLPDGNWTWFYYGKKWKQGNYSEGELIGECNILLDLSDFEEATFTDRLEKIMFRRDQEESPGCDANYIKATNTYNY